jgi:uncharacterized protein (TIGR00255 family)
MTGFAVASRIAEPFQIHWEIRSVNNRFLDLNFRLPEELKSLEATLRDEASVRISRGKVDCSLKLLAAGGGGTVAKEIDHATLGQLRQWQQAIEAEWTGIAPLSVADLLRWPGFLKDPEIDTEALAGPAREAFAEAVAGLIDARAREGSRIADVLEQRLSGITALLAHIAPRLAGTAERHRTRLLERLERLDIDADPQRLEQEIALIAQRLDVSEETDRLAGHVAELADILTRDEPVGRRLDFLIQELNREANTLGSKVQDDDLTRAAVDLKVLIEQMREQVQNLE